MNGSRVLTITTILYLAFGFSSNVLAQRAAISSPDNSLPRQQKTAYWTSKAKENWRGGNFPEAERLLDLAIAAQHDLVDAYLLRAKVRQQRGNLPGANADYTSVIHLQPENYDARFQRALILQEAQRYAAARADFQFLLDHPAAETNSIYYQSEKQNGELVVTGFTTLQSNMRSEWLNAVGLTYYHEGENAGAQEYFSQAIAKDSTYAAAYLNLGLIAERQADTLEAMSFYRKTLALAPDNATAFRNLASIARLRQDAELMASINYQYGGDSYEGLLQQGLTCLEQNDFSGAINKFTQALDWQPNSNEAHLQRGFAYEKAELLTEALADYSVVIKADPLAEKAFSNRGNVYFKNERYVLAVADFTRAIALNPENDRALYNRGIAYQRLGELKNACQDWHQAQVLGNTAAERPLSSLCDR